MSFPNLRELKHIEYMCRSGMKYELPTFLFNNPNYVSNSFGEHGEYAAHFAAIGNHPENMSLLVEKDKENVNVRDSYGITPLHYAVINSSKDVIELLLEKGADMNATNNDGESVLQWCPPDIKKILESKGDSHSAGEAPEPPRPESPPRREEFIYPEGLHW